MPKFVRFSVLIFFLITLFLFCNTSVYSAPDYCTVSVSPTNISENSSGNLEFTITNGEATPVNYVKILRPSDKFNVTGGSLAGFSVQTDGSSATFLGDGGFLGASATEVFTVSVTTQSSYQGSWVVTVSDSLDGAGSVTCTGSSTVAIGSSPADTTAPSFSGDVTISNLSNSSATFSFTTNESSTSQLQYGTSENFGNQVTGGTTTGHSLGISSLSANTKYYYKITITDSAGNSTSTTTSSFVTARDSSVTTVTSTVTVTKTTTKEIVDTIFPSVLIDGKLDKSYKKAPLISATAKDNKGIGKVEYSTDGGTNWNIISLDQVGSKIINFSFTPAVFDDDDYKIRLRAFDSSGNMSLSPNYILTIDRLPPTLGGVFYSFGNVMLPFQKQKVFVSGAGGISNMDLYIDEKKYSMEKDVEENIWFSEINFIQSGEYSLKVLASDSLGNKTEKDLPKIKVFNAGKVSSKSKLTVYSYDEKLKTFKIWDGSAYGISNPQYINQGESYSYLLPKGKYYLKAQSKGKRDFVSNIFHINRDSVLGSDISYSNLIFGFINIPKIENIKINEHDFYSYDISINGISLPDFELSSTAGNNITSFSIRGKPTLFTFIDTRFSGGFDQLEAMETFSDDKRFNIIPVALLQPKSSVFTYSKKGNFKLPIYYDTDGVMVPSLKVTYLPVSYFIDKKGQVKKIISQKVNRDEILENLLD